jgi:hypothetical protein
MTTAQKVAARLAGAEVKCRNCANWQPIGYKIKVDAWFGRCNLSMTETMSYFGTECEKFFFEDRDRSYG